MLGKKCTTTGVLLSLVLLAVASAAYGGALFETMTSDGSDGALSITDANFWWYLYTSDSGDKHAGDLWKYAWGYDFTWTYVSNGGRLVSQGPGKPDIWAWDFTTINIIYPLPLTVCGDRPGALLATGDMNIGGLLKVEAGGGTGGNWQQLSGGGAGGGNGVWNQGGAGGAGYVKDGSWGLHNGGATTPGGPAYSEWGILQGGSGGGCSKGSGFYGTYYANGGAGGGALLLSTPGNLTITSNGKILAEGVNGNGRDSYTGGGGGGSGGYLAFNVGGTINNAGKISATGGAGGNLNDPWAGGSGSGGMIYLDPTAIINTGTITVAGGANYSSLAGTIGLDPGVTISGEGSVVGNITYVPEPSTILLAGFGLLAGLSALWHQRRH